jgi:hypothetical protein
MMEGREQQDRSRDDQAEPAEDRERELLLPPDPAVERLDQREDARHGERKQADPELEPRIDPALVRVALDAVAHPPATESEPAHVGPQDGRDRERADAEQVAEKARPDDLVDQPGASGDQERAAEERHQPRLAIGDRPAVLRCALCLAARPLRSLRLGHEPIMKPQSCVRAQALGVRSKGGRDRPRGAIMQRRQWSSRLERAPGLSRRKIC